jgi:tetratricopeptide (TPR) repeat protein
VLGEEHRARALAIRKKAHGEEHPHTARLLNNLDWLYYDLANYAAARERYERALTIQSQVLGDEHPATALTQSNLGALFGACGEWRGAADAMDEARRVSARHQAKVLPGLAQDEQLRFLQSSDTEDFYVAMTLGLRQAGDERIARHSAEWLLNGKRVGHEALAAQTLLLRDAKNPPSLRR